MPITINTNVSAMISQRNLASASSRSASSLSKLSSGSRVPSAKEDAASLAVGTGLKVEVSALKAAQVNAQQATSLLQVADGAFSQISDILTRMKSLATTGQSGQLSGVELNFLNQEYGLLSNEIDRIAGTTEFNGQALLGGSNTVVVDQATINAVADASAGFVGYEFDASKVTAGDTFTIEYDNTSNILTFTNDTTTAAQSIFIDTAPADGTTTELEFTDIGLSVTLNADFDPAAAIASTAAAVTSTGGLTSAAASFEFQVGSGNGVINTDNRISITIAEGNFDALVGGAATNLTSTAASATASDEIDDAVEAVNTARAAIGANLNKLEFAQSNLAVTIENTEAARSTLMDVDVSAEITKFSSEQVLIQAGVSMLAQANQQPSLLLRLLQ